MMPFHRDAAVHIHLVAAHVSFVTPMMVALRLHRTAVVMVVMALQARHQSYGDRTRHHSIGAHQNHRPPEARNLLRLIPSRPRPRRSHDDVTLQQQHRDTGSPHRLRFTSRGPDRRAGDARHHPQGGSTGVPNNSGGQDHGVRSRPGDEGPQQLERRKRREEHTRGHPIAPMHRRDREMNDRCPDRRGRRTTGSQKAVSLLQMSDGHGFEVVRVPLPGTSSGQ